MPNGSESSSGVPPLLPRSGKKYLLWAGALALLLLATLIGYFVLKGLLSVFGPSPQVIASYQGDYQMNAPKEPWRYLWNALGPVGAATNYVSLQWDGRRYTDMNTPDWPRPAPAHYLRLTEAGGHPGQGIGQPKSAGNDVDRFVIAAFTVPEAGRYWITNSSLSRVDGGLNGSIHLRMFVNDREVGPLVHCRSRDRQPFDRALRKLSAGDTIYVAVGPNEMDTNDFRVGLRHRALKEGFY